MIFRRSPHVPVLRNYEDYRDAYLRPDFQYRCAYCLTHEHFFLDGEAGEIDHHRPLQPPPALGLDFSALKNAYHNLYWSCRGCNQRKGNRWPTDEEYHRGDRFLDPCVEDHDDHWDTQTDGAVFPKTPVGAYTIRHIRLNRARLVWRRAQMFQDQQKAREIERQLLRSDLPPDFRAVLLHFLEQVQAQLNPPVFR